MSTIDKQRIAAVRTLERLGYQFVAGEWVGPAAQAQALLPLVAEADALHALLVMRADQLDGFTEGSPEEAELKAIAAAIEGYEGVRWPTGRTDRGKG